MKILKYLPKYDKNSKNKNLSKYIIKGKIEVSILYLSHPVQIGVVLKDIQRDSCGR